MQTATRPYPTSTSARRLTIIRRLTPTQSGLVRIAMTKGKKTQVDEYELTLDAVSPGCGEGVLTFTKTRDSDVGGLRASTYCVLINKQFQAEACECAGWLSHGKCKHQAAAEVVLDRL